jgi:hypothetical protein
MQYCGRIVSFDRCKGGHCRAGGRLQIYVRKELGDSFATACLLDLEITAPAARFHQGGRVVGG